ncbi:ABC-F family ATP-binding cassette domain-containing protein [Oerskovia flava]|uniref:ABC-F family ATP-binding cassette domain-containing protein n=1 Tax=Oerskovia flava TaxID=2986422 RepID=UPI00223EE62C|nr:ABC-F family ATP-binding cassette domain-containing protein [Oerskovia sp. JB1-3-2]
MTSAHPSPHHSSSARRTPVLRAQDLAKSYDGRAVLRDVTLAVDPGHRTGLVGENGAGKSTLLRLLAGLEDPDAGTVEIPDDVGHLHQELPYPSTWTVGDVVDDALAGVRRLEAELEASAVALAGTGQPPHGASTTDGALPGAATYDHALLRAELADVWDADARAARTLAGLGLVGSERRPLGRLSGGQRSRVGLAALLIRQPGALLLDEPTNHLDDDAADYLATALRALPGAVLLASHDRVFLDEVCTEIVDLDPGGAMLYGGSYSDYLVAKRVERGRWEERFAVEQAELRDLRRTVATTARQVGHDRPIRDGNKMAFGRRGDRVEGQVSRRVRDAQRRLATLERVQVRRPPVPMRLAPPPARWAPDDPGGLVLWARDVVVHGDGEAVRLDLPAAGAPSIAVARGARLLVTGGNGTGKSTLLHALAGDVRPSAGVVGRARGAVVALLEQDVHLGDEARTPREILTLVQGDRGADGGRDVDAHGLVAPRDLGRPLADLSVGQRRRVVLAMLLSQTPDVLLLDEPTNHFSLTLATELLEAIESWPGAVVVASHDRWLRRSWRGDVVHLTPGGQGIGPSTSIQ